MPQATVPALIPLETERLLADAGYLIVKVSDIVCATHDGIPNTAEERAEWEAGGDPCEHVIRVWPDDAPV